MSLTDPTTWLTAGGALTGLAGLSWLGRNALRLGRAVWPYVRAAQQFLEDWQGERAREGVPGRPGVMKRLEALDQQIVAVRELAQSSNVTAEAGQATAEAAATQATGTLLAIDGVRQQLDAVVEAVAEMQTSHSSTLRDAVDQIENSTIRLVARDDVATLPPRQRPAVDDLPA